MGDTEHDTTIDNGTAKSTYGFGEIGYTKNWGDVEKLFNKISVDGISSIEAVESFFLALLGENEEISKMIKAVAALGVDDGVTLEEFKAMVDIAEGMTEINLVGQAIGGNLSYTDDVTKNIIIYNQKTKEASSISGRASAITNEGGFKTPLTYTQGDPIDTALGFNNFHELFSNLVNGINGVNDISYDEMTNDHTSTKYGNMIYGGSQYIFKES